MLPIIALLFAPLAFAAPDAPTTPPLETEDGLDAAYARAAVRSGLILPLDQILDRLRAGTQGQVIEIQLELEEGAPVYEFDLIGPDGHVFEVEIDAATGRITEIEDGPGEED